MATQIPLCSDRRLQRALRHLVQDLSAQPTLAELARVAGLSRPYFCRHFQEAIGVSFSTWNRHIRVGRAKELLADSDVPITTIAIMVGYRDITTFERNFRKTAGCSPRHYRSSQRAAHRILNIATVADKSTMNAEIVGDEKA
jgi:transcriptional regulator GlxA family with amidase domain